MKNEHARQFDNQKESAVVVSDLTYVRVDGKWNYVCLFVDLFNREIIGHSAGPKDVIEMFHTDGGSEFENEIIDEVLETFSIKRSLSIKGCPYDNAVAEAIFNVVKTEFTNGAYFNSLD